MYAEGGRSRGALRSARRARASDRLALESGAPVVPVAIVGTQGDPPVAARALPSRQRPLRRLRSASSAGPSPSASAVTGRGARDLRPRARDARRARRRRRRTVRRSPRPYGNRSSSTRPDERRRPGTVVDRHEPLEPAHHHGGLCRVLARARSAAPAAASATAITVACRLRPRESVRPRQSSTGTKPGAARSPRRSGRGATRGRRSRSRAPRDGRRALARDRAAARGPRRPGPPGSRIELVVARRRSRHRPRRWRRPARAGCGRSSPRARRAATSADSSSTTCDRARVLALLGGERQGALRRARTSAQAPRATLGLRDHLVGDDQHVVGGDLGQRRAASTRARSSPRRTSPTPSSGRASMRSGGRSGGGSLGERARDVGHRRAGAVELGDRAARHAGLAPDRRPAAPAARSGRPRCRRRRAASPPSSTRWLEPRLGRPRPRGARADRAPKLGAIASGGRSRSALVPVPWRSGTISAPSDSSCRGRGQLVDARRGRAAGCRPARAATRS